MAYRPTSLDFINRPNPVEPHTDPHKHPLHADQNHLRLLHDATNNVGGGEPPRKRRKSREEPSQGLSRRPGPDEGRPADDVVRPTLPAVPQQGEKRLRIPPTLSGLHQPPPDAGILPSISVDGLRGVDLPERGAAKKPGQAHRKKSSENAEIDKSSDHQHTSVKSTNSAGSQPARSRKNKKWTDAETKCLLKGVEKHGIGHWTKILKDPDLEFDRRSALDIKDRFRVCCPQHCKAAKDQVSAESPSRNGADGQDGHSQKPKRRRTTHRKTQAELREIGVENAFVPSKRRPRKAYSEEEDQAILLGFEKYGKKWSLIQQDDSLGLGDRRAMDLRDRVRTRWPEQYTSAGLKLQHERSRGVVRRESHKPEEGEAVEPKKPALPNTRDKTPPPAAQQTAEKALKDSNTSPASLPSAKRMPAPFLADDVFWSLPHDAAGLMMGDDEQRIVLDRQILDWPFTGTGPAKPGTTIDPIATLHLPRPNTNALPQSTSAAAVHGASLPSLATVTAGPYDFGDAEQLGLPSLMEGFGALYDASGGGGDGRPGAGSGMLSLDEITG